MPKQTRPYRAGALLLAGLTACSSPTVNTGPPELVLEYNFNSDEFAAWEFGLSDILPSQEAAVDFQASQRTLPVPLQGTQGFYQAGTNVSDDLFMYFARSVSGLTAGKLYRFRFQVEFATNYQSGCTAGTGASVWIKAGASLVHPQAVLANDGSLRMNVAKGEQSAGGADAQVLGDIRNGVPGCPASPRYELRTLGPLGGSITIRADNTGTVWFFLGTESGFETRHEIYFTKFVIGATELPDS